MIPDSEPVTVLFSGYRSRRFSIASRVSCIYYAIGSIAILFCSTSRYPSRRGLPAFNLLRKQITWSLSTSYQFRRLISHHSRSCWPELGHLHKKPLVIGFLVCHHQDLTLTACQSGTILFPDHRGPPRSRSRTARSYAARSLLSVARSCCSLSAFSSGLYQICLSQDSVTELSQPPQALGTGHQSMQASRSLRTPWLTQYTARTMTIMLLQTACMRRASRARGKSLNTETRQCANDDADHSV